MRNIRLTGLLFALLIFFSACGASNPLPANSGEKSEPFSEADAPSFPLSPKESSNAAGDGEPAGNATAGTVLSRLEMSEYDRYEGAKIMPTAEQLQKYLKKAVAFHQAAIDGETELWALDLSGQPNAIRNTQLLAYPVILNGEARYLGADRNTGTIYSWSRENANAFPDVLDAPEIFAAPEHALAYVKSNYWDALNFIVPYEMELTPPDANAESGRRYPYYQSQTVSLGAQTLIGIIDIDRADEQSYTAHMYEIVMDSPTEGHTAISGWYKVYKNGFIVDDIFGNTWIADEAMS